jgi:hypothetical protein
MSRIIDYAGMYPPTNLPLEEAFRNFTAYQSNPDVWMLSRFVIPVKRLAELPKFEESLSFTALGRGGKDAGDFLANLNFDIDDINSFREAQANGIVDMFETALPALALTDKFAANDVTNRAADALNKNGITVFFECPSGQGWQDRAGILIRALKKIKDKHVGFKLRAGGVTADAFPSTKEIAWTIAEVHDAGVPLKCTAGLHHAMRHYNGSAQTKMHGFLNVFGAGALARTGNISQSEIQSILDDENPANFVFDENGFEWQGLRVAASEIIKARQFATSFGSCSFDEPREDLRNLGLL